MSEANSYSPTLSLKVVINKQKSKVLFAEANSHVTDILLSFLTLPLGKIVRILEKHYGDDAPIFGSLTTLHRGLVNLDSTHFSTAGAKQMLVNPRSPSEAECRRLKIDITDSRLPTFYVCNDVSCNHTGPDNISLFSDIAVCSCGKPMRTELVVGERLVGEEDDDDGVFTINTSSMISDDGVFIISDDLRVVPNVMGFVQTLENLGITDIDGAEMKSFSLCITKIMDLLFYALTSTNPLTELFIDSDDDMITYDLEYEHVFSSGHIETEEDSDKDKKMILKVSLQKSTSKFLFAQAKDDFIDFLLSFLTIPLGQVGSILGGKTCLKSIDNLYASVSNVIDDKYFKEPNSKDSLISPSLACGYVSEIPFLPLSQENPPSLYFLEDSPLDRGIFSREECGPSVTSFKSSVDLEWGHYVKKPAEYIVSDDLTVCLIV